MTSDNASTNDRACRVLQRCLDHSKDGGQTWNARQRRVRCMEHTLHLAAKDFVETICPTPSRYKKVRSSSKSNTTPPTPSSSSAPSSKKSGVQVEDVDEGKEDDDEDGDEIDDESWKKELEKIADAVEVDEAVDFEPGDLLGKVLALINQVCLLYLH